MNVDDRQVVLDRARQGDAHALGELLESYRPYLRVMVRALRRGRLAARMDDSDLMQDALLEAHRNFSTFNGTTLAELVAWLRQVVVRTAGRSMRAHLVAGKRAIGREQLWEGLSSLVPGSIATPSTHAMQHEQAAQLAAALERLPEDMQQVIVGRHIEHLTHAVLAERMGRTEEAIRALYIRALRRLQDEFPRSIDSAG